tara:strand:- start:5703 stop:6368 length:666 start_codon:yes stop_codon:yes gene_type:complete
MSIYLDKFIKVSNFMSTINFIHIAKNAGSSIEKYCNKNKKIQYHGHDAEVSCLENQMIIIRDPYSRFCSAVRYAIKNYPDSQKIRKIINAGLITPNHWAEAWADKSHTHHNLIMNEIKNHEHKIDSVKIPLKWTYIPQHYWINESKLRYVVPFDDINSYLLYRFDFKVPVINKSKYKKDKQIDDLSDKSKKFLKEIYKKDFEFIEKYSNFQVSTWYLNSKH